MHELVREIPDVSFLLSLAPEELAAKILFHLRARQKSELYRDMAGHGESFMAEDLINEFWSKEYRSIRTRDYPFDQRDEVNLAFYEAWAWLEAQGLLIPESDMNGRQGCRVLSRRAQRMESAAEFANFKIARLLPKEILHPRIADEVWGSFMRGKYDVAVFQAVKAVEVLVRVASGLQQEDGQDLMRKAFSPQGGPLADMTSKSSERQGRSDLFAGAIASYKNPQSHRDVNLEDPLEALEIIYLANHLLRIVDARAKGNQDAQP